MKFRLGPDAERTRVEVRAFLAHHFTDEMRERMHQTGTWHDVDFVRAVGARGWIAPTWPHDLGGAGLDWEQQFVIREEMDKADAPVAGMYLSMFVASAIAKFGTPEQQAAFVPRITGGELAIALGYTEANNGSDAAAARTTAVREGTDWVVDGEKMFTTMAQVSEYVFLLARTDASVPAHKGLTMFLVPLAADGVTVGRLATLGGERTNVTSYQGVRIPDTLRIGGPGHGWRVLLSALQSEQSANWGPHVERMLGAAIEAASVDGPAGPVIARSLARTRAARVAVDVEASRLLALRMNWLTAQGRRKAADGPMLQLYSSIAYTRGASVLLDVLASSTPSPMYSSVSGPHREVEHAYRHSQVTRIYGGTSEILRSIIAEQGLGLPRTR